MISPFLNALKGQNHSGKPPIWIMRQAGRYLPSYRALREKSTFLEMVHTPEIAAEVTLLPFKELAFDAAIVFSDILVIPEAFQMGLHFEEKKGPIIARPVRQRGDLAQLTSYHTEEALGYVASTIKILKKELTVPLIGFAGAPFTVASYMIEGGSSRDLKLTKQWLVRDPEGFHELLDRVTQSTIEYLNLQIDAGVDALQLFDSWAGVLAPSQFEACSLRYLRKIIKGLKDPSVPLIYFSKGASTLAVEIALAGPQGMSLDWCGSLPAVRKAVGSKIALQGNLDPFVLYGNKETIQQETHTLLKSMKGDPAYIFNLGHGILPDIPLDAVKVLVDTVKK